VAGLAALAALASAQPAVIRTETRLVLVDAIVHDKKGKLAGDLGAADFRIWEDGKERPIASFSREAAQDQTERQYLLFLFDNSTPSGISIRQDVAAFAGAYANPDRNMAVMNFNGELSIAQNFTAMAERVQRAAADVSQIGTRGVGRPAVMAPRPDLHSSIGDASSHYPGYYPSTALATPEMGAMIRMAQSAQSPFLFPIVEAIRDVANSMAAIRGRKLIVVLGGNDPLHDSGPTAATLSAASDCNKANVAVYATSTSLKSLSEETGGRWLPDNLVRELSRLMDDQEKRYVLGFKPVESPDGSCHSLRVRTVRAGLEVTARDAYCNSKAPDLLAGKVEGKALEARAASPSAGNATATIELPYFYNSPGIALVDLAMEMDLTNLKFARQNGKQHAELDLLGLTYGADGEVAARFSDTVPFDFATAQEAEAFRKQPYRYEHQFRLPAGRYNVRVAFSSGEQSFGKAEAPLMIDPWDGQRLALGGIALASETRKVPDLASDLDPSLLEGHKDLIAASAEISPSGGSRFSHSAPCFGYLEVYDASLAGLNPPRFGLAVRVFDQRSGDQKDAKAVDLAKFVRPGNPVIPVLIDVPIASLPTGSYRLEAKVVRTPGNESVARTVEFSVE
jgi:VWFA-related protein